MTIEVEKQMVDGIYLAKSATITSGGVEGTSVTIEGNVIKIVVANKLVTGNYQLELEKVDKDDPTIKLQGAEFNVTLLLIDSISVLILSKSFSTKNRFHSLHLLVEFW